TYIDLDRVDYGARASVTYPMPIGALAHRLTAGFDFQRQRDDRKNFNYLNTPGDSATADTSRSLDQLEHVTEIGPFLQSALELSPRTTITGGMRYDWVKFAVHDALIPYELAAPRFYYRNAGSTRHRGVELSGDFSLMPGVNLAAVWTYADYRYRRYSFTTGTTVHTLDGRALPGVPQHWLHLIARAQPAPLRGA